MPELTPARGVETAAQPVVQRTPNMPMRTGASLTFRSLLQKPLAGPQAARGPKLSGSSIIHADPTTEEPAATHPAAQRRQRAEVLDPESRAEPFTLDPLWCQLAVQHVGTFSLSPPEASAAAAASGLAFREDLQTLVSGLARRIAWGGDKRKGSARLELCDGALAGATLVVHTEERSVSVELELPAGASALGWQTRILERLEARGFSARVRVG